jgi:murein L,D-transpeptidase YcbB/YkuD
MSARVTSKAAPSLVVAIVLFASGCGSSGPPAAEVSKSIRTRLTAGSIGGERLLEPKAVAAFYQGRGAKRAWEGNDADQIVKAIHGIERDGLNPADYHTEAIERSLAERKTATAESEADLDLLLTDAVAAMIDHMRYGRVHPASLDSRWNVDPRDDAPPLEQEVAKVADAGQVEEALAAERPKHFIYDGLLGALAELRDIAAKGGWAQVPAGKPIKPGATDARIPAVRARLMASGELPKGADAQSTAYDGELQKAVELFQARHRLDSDGVIDKDMIAAMNVSAEERANQVRVNLERARWVVHGLADDFLLVNLPAFKAYLIRGGKNVWESRTQIGEEAKQTPTFRADMRTVVFNPDWTVPPMIIAQEVLEGMRKDPSYLAEKNLALFDQSNQPVDAASVDWGDASPENFAYTVRQPPGQDNALGQVKFLFPNKYSIYLHDTPSRSKFQAEIRTFSHGCIRLENPLELADRLLSEQGWSRGRIEEAVATGETKNVAIAHPLPVLIVYWTVSVGASGEIRYMQDFYNLDPPVLAALDAQR